jgi:hypothetical protein
LILPQVVYPFFIDILWLCYNRIGPWMHSSLPIFLTMVLGSH